MATIQDLGKVAYFNKGIYNSETTYEINDVVSYNGSSYVSLGNDNLGNLPTNTAFWSIVASKGDKGDTGKAFVIEKTYASIEDMVDDYDNMNVDDYVMIQGSIEDEENATLWTKTDTEVSPYKWVYLADFSGASGITGATPNIQIGTVTEGNQPSVTRRAGSSNENPILDFVLKTGAKGDTGATGNGISGVTKTSTSGLTDTYTISYTSGNSSTFDVHNGKGISSIAKTTSVGLVDTYTITYNDGTTSTFDITNGEDGSVTQEQLDETNEEVERVNMVYNALPKVSGEGTVLTLNNTAKCPVYDIELSPSELEQETTTGKNLANIITSNQILYSSSSYNHFTLVNGKITTDGSALVGYKIKVNPNTQYTAQLFGTFTSGTNQLRIREFSAEPVNWDTNYIKQSNASIINGAKTSLTVTTDATTEWILLAIYTSESGLVCDEFQFELGDTATNYEEYTGGQPSPNPQYPQQIHTVSGDNAIKVSNKNLFDGIFELGIISETTGQNSSNDNYMRNKNYIPVEELTNYKFSTDNQNITAVLVYEYKADYTYNLITNKAVNLTNYLTTNSGTKYIRFRPSYQTTDTTIKFQIEKGTTATTYTPHQEQNFPITLGDLEYCKIGDYEDVFFKNVVGSEYYDSTLELDKWYLKKNVGKVVLNGTEDWLYNSTYKYFRIINTGSLKNTNTITNYFAGSGSSSSTIPYLIAGNSEGLLWLRDNTDYFNATVSTLTNWLSTHNVIVYYVLATPTYTLLNNTLQTQLDNLSKAISYQDQTNVSQTNNDLPFVIKLSAIRDLSGIFDLITE